MYGGRSRKGAWIEIISIGRPHINGCGRSRKGAWIEILAMTLTAMVVIGRSRKGAWIEIIEFAMSLKLARRSLPQGSVD